MIDLKWTDVKKAVDDKAIVLLPLGVVEEHGPHLCLGTDIYTAEVMCSRIQRELSIRGIESIIAPPFYWGICQSTKGFIGSFNIRLDTAKNLVLDILSSLHGFGFTEAYGINAHGDIEQNVLFMTAFKEAQETIGINARYCFRSEVMHFYGLNGGEPFICPIAQQQITVSEAATKDIHAGDIETATINRFYGECVDIDLVMTLPAIGVDPGREMEWILGGKTKELSELGYAGDPANYAAVKIDEHIADTAKRYADAIIEKRGYVTKN
jgi:creatinine amidohydrolase